MGLKLKAGRWFDPNRPIDDQTLPYPSDPAVERAIATRGVNVVINELAAKRLGFGSAQNAVGKLFRGQVISNEISTDIHVIGVVGNSQFRSARDPIQPLMFAKVNRGSSW